MRAGDRNRKFIPDRNADPVLHPSLLSGSPGGLRSTVFLKTLSGTIPHSSQMLLPSDEGNGMGGGIMGNRGRCLRKLLPLRPSRSRKHPDGLVTSDVPAVSKPPTLE